MQTREMCISLYGWVRTVIPAFCPSVSYNEYGCNLVIIASDL